MLWGAGVPLTVAQLCERCEDPWAPTHVSAWMASAFKRGLVRARRSHDLPLEISLTRKGAKLARRIARETERAGGTRAAEPRA